MQNKIAKIITILFLSFISKASLAQVGRDTLIKSGKEKVWVASDSIAFHNKKMKLDSAHIKMLKHKGIVFDRSDSFYKRLPDSIHRKIAFKRGISDSLRFKRMDSIHFKYKTKLMDSLHFRVKMRDSLHFKFDSAFRYKHMRSDSLHRKFKMERMRSDSFRYVKMDSLKHHLKFRQDSLHMKMKMRDLDIRIRKIKRELKEKGDTVKLGSVKTISMQFACNPDATVEITGLSRNIRIRQSETGSVRLVSTMPGNESKGEDDASSFRNLGIAVSGSAERVKITRVVSRNVFEKRKTGQRTNSSTLVVYVPSKSSMKIENSLADVVIEKHVVDVDVTVREGNLSMANADKAVIKSTDGFVKAGFIGDADIQLSGSRLNFEAIENLKINSKYSNVSFVRASVFAFKSLSDKYEVQQVTDVNGDKTFGELKISNLKNSFVLTGSSADVKINKIDLKAELICIDNKYADIKLPVTHLTNYSVKFGGQRTNVSAPFEKQFTYDTANAINNSNTQHKGNFTASVGDVNSGHTKFQIKCNSCIVDFN